jgi:hypothetical protein
VRKLTRYSILKEEIERKVSKAQFLCPLALCDMGDAKPTFSDTLHIIW